MHRLHEFFTDVMDDIVTLLRSHPRLRSHEPITLGEGLKHGIGVGAKFEFARAKGACNRQGRRLAVATVAVDAEIIVDGLALGKILGAQFP
mgnify:CR=1 FL=1